MSYPKKYKELTIEYRREGHTLEETHKTLKVSISTILKWEKQLEKEGNLDSKVLQRKFKKIDPEKLQEYIKEHPDAYQIEIAEVFNCTATAIRKAFKRLGITRKKN